MKYNEEDGFFSFLSWKIASRVENCWKTTLFYLETKEQADIIKIRETAEIQILSLELSWHFLSVPKYIVASFIKSKDTKESLFPPLRLLGASESLGIWTKKAVIRVYLSF